eukprot:11325148-Alexandrium_andersonii.AAC.1
MREAPQATREARYAIREARTAHGPQIGGARVRSGSGTQSRGSASDCGSGTWRLTSVVRLRLVLAIGHQKHTGNAP